jgi:peptidoglycan lytic transglycosylase
LRRHRRRRRRLAALALLPFAAAAATTSIALAASSAAPSAHISASENTVRYGKAVRLSGTVPGTSGTPVQIAFRRDGGEEWRVVHSAATDVAGAYAARIKPPASGAYRAQAAGGGPSAAAPVRVLSLTRFRVKRHVVVGHRVRLSGRVLPAAAGRPVRITLPGPDERTRTRSGGRFKETWRPRSAGEGKARAFAQGDVLAAASHSRAGRVTVYRPASASWYGPGLYGNRTACGQTLSASTLGVANKSMPCGTKLTLRYRGRSVRVRVIDRGPFVGGREFDLTGATKNRLGFGSTGTVLSSR